MSAATMVALGINGAAATVLHIATYTERCSMNLSQKLSLTFARQNGCLRLWGGSLLWALEIPAGSGSALR